MYLFVKELWSLLNARHRRYFWVVAISASLMSLTEMLGLSVIAGFINLVFNNSIDNSPVSLKYAVDSMSQTTGYRVIHMAGALVIAIYVLRNLIYLVGSWLQIRYTQAVRHDFSVRQLRYYLNREYVYFLKSNSTESINRIYTEIDRFSISGLQQLLVLLTDVMLIVGLTGLLIVTGGFKAFIGVLGFVVLTGFLYYPVKKWSRKYGMLLSQSARASMMSLRQLFDGIKTVKANNAEASFAKIYEAASSNMSRAKVGFVLSSIIARPTIELVGIFLLVFGLTWSEAEKNTQAMAGVAAMIVMAAYRLMPTIPRIIACFSSMESVIHILKEISLNLNEVAMIAPANQDSFKFDQSIAFKSVSFRYSKEESNVINSLDLVFRTKGLYAITGENGSGKTTLIDLLLGLLTPSHGQITIDDRVLTESNARFWRDCIGYVPQETFITNDSLKNNILFGDTHTRDESRIDHVLKQVKLSQFFEGSRSGIETHLGESGNRLSGGQKQRVGIARALYRGPKILVLDEPTSSLDLQNSTDLIEVLKTISLDRVVIIVTHDDKICNVSDVRIRL